MTANRKAKHNAIIFLLVATFGLYLFALLNDDGILSTSQPYNPSNSEFSVRDLGFLSGSGGTPFAWVLALAVAAGYSMFSIRRIPLVREHWRKFAFLKLLSVALALAAAIVEEAAFRRLIMDLVWSAGGGWIVQVLASALLFGLVHGVWGIMTRRLEVGIGVMIATGTLGAALAVTYLIRERSLGPPILSHFIVTAVIQPGVTLAAFTGQMHEVRTA